LKISSIETIPIRIPFLEPFKVTYGALSGSDHVIVRIHTNEGLVGLGDASPLTFFTGETQASAMAAVSELLSPLLVGEDPLEVERLIDKMDKVAGNHSAKSAIDQALHDLAGKFLETPVYNLLGGRYRDRVQVSTGIGIKEPEAMAKDVVWVKEQGFHTVKIKIGLEPTKDVERVRAVREAVGDDMEIRVDANAGYDSKTAIRVIGCIEKYRPQYVEQPVAEHAIKDMAMVRRSVNVPIMADESVFSPQDALEIVKMEAADIIGVKFSKCGGIWKAKRIAAIADSAGLPCVMISAFESGIGLAANAQVAASTRNMGLPCELAMWTIHKHDPTKGLEVEGEHIKLTNRPGLGVTFETARLP